MEWRDEGILLAVRSHGEANAIIEVLTTANGRQAGLVRGGRSPAMAAMLQPGAELSVEWSARLGDHLGHIKPDLIRGRAADIMSDRGALCGLNAIVALVLAMLPEREPNGDLYHATRLVVDGLADGAPHWPADYARWEVVLLAALGFPVDLSSCAATGQRHDLTYVSPRSGRAVSRAPGGAWADRLLPLPGFLIGKGPVTMGAVRESVRMTGHFLEHWAAPAFELSGLPEARARLLRIFDTHELPDLPPPEPPGGDEATYARSLGATTVLKVPTRRVMF